MTNQIHKTFAISLFLLSWAAQGQSDLPYVEIPEYPEVYTAETVAARMIDGLGFRYYWATDGLRDEDLAYKPSEEARTCRQTLEHIHGLTRLLLNCARGDVHTAEDVAEWSFEALRRATLMNIQEASQIMKSGEVKVSELIIRFENSETTYPFWNQINGPIADAIWHAGQVVSMRRASGNPFDRNVSLFTGKLRK